MITGNELIRNALPLLKEAGVEGPARDARLLLAHALGIAASRLTLVLPDPVDHDAQKLFEGLIARRAQREPLSHLTGKRAFYGREFLVSSAVLDPRPDTELLIDLALAQPFKRVLDLGTGSGCIAITLLAERPEATGQAFDLSQDALDVASQNASALGVADRLELRQSNWFAEAEGLYDLIISNPPYIAVEEMAGLEPEVREHEPNMALTDWSDGLEAYRQICGAAKTYLAPQGRLIFEFGPTQAQAITAIAEAAGWQSLALHKDLDGRDRALIFVSAASKP